VRASVLPGKLLLKAVLFFLLLYTGCCEAVIDSPWMTGPLLSPSGHTVPPGYINLEPYLFYTDNFGVYNNRFGKSTSTPMQTIWNPLLVAYYGLTNHLDIETAIPYQFNRKNSQSDNGFGDLSLTLGIQAVSDIPHTLTPDIKFLVQELFPTGKYEELDPTLNGADAIGSGSYQTTLGVVFQKLWFLPKGRFLRSRLGFTYTIPSNVHLHGLSSFGGSVNTNGTLAPGNEFTAILGLEYTLTQHWVPALDILFEDSAANGFRGFAGTDGLMPAVISLEGGDRLSIAPAIEYNFNAEMGLIAGVWFSVAGRNEKDFISGVVAFDYTVAT